MKIKLKGRRLHRWKNSSGNADGSKHPNKETLSGCFSKVAETLEPVCGLPRLFWRWWCRIRSWKYVIVFINIFRELLDRTTNKYVDSDWKLDLFAFLTTTTNYNEDKSLLQQLCTWTCISAWIWIPTGTNSADFRCTRFDFLLGRLDLQLHSNSYSTRTLAVARTSTPGACLNVLKRTAMRIPNHDQPRADLLTLYYSNVSFQPASYQLLWGKFTIETPLLVR
jgi:hypothetical protein